jgi:hypothetical protein
MARVKRLVTGDNIDAKFNNIDRILNKLTSRTKSVIGTIVMPPVPIIPSIQTISEDGLIFRCLLPVAGQIQRAYLHVEKIASKVKPQLTIIITQDQEARTLILPYKQGLNILEPSITVSAGTRLTLSTSDVSSVSGLSIGLVFLPTVSTAVKEQVALTAHLDALEADNADESSGGKA